MSAKAFIADTGNLCGDCKIVLDKYRPLCYNYQEQFYSKERIRIAKMPADAGHFAYLTPPCEGYAPQPQRGAAPKTLFCPPRNSAKHFMFHTISRRANKKFLRKFFHVENARKERERHGRATNKKNI